MAPATKTIRVNPVKSGALAPGLGLLPGTLLRQRQKA